MSQCTAHFSCPACGHTHQVATMLQIERGPATSGAVTELYGDGPLPQALAELLGAMVWCKRAGVYVPMKERAQAGVTPRRG